MCQCFFYFYGCSAIRDLHFNTRGQTVLVWFIKNIYSIIIHNSWFIAAFKTMFDNYIILIISVLFYLLMFFLIIDDIFLPNKFLLDAGQCKFYCWISDNTWDLHSKLSVWCGLLFLLLFFLNFNISQTFPVPFQFIALCSPFFFFFSITFESYPMICNYYLAQTHGTHKWISKCFPLHSVLKIPAVSDSEFWSLFYNLSKVTVPTSPHFNLCQMSQGGKLEWANDSLD